MTASERARELVARNEGAAMTFWEEQTFSNYETFKKAHAALLAYVARLEAVERAARSVALCLAQMPGWSERTMQSDREHILLTRDDLLTALAALDRPEE